GERVGGDRGGGACVSRPGEAQGRGRRDLGSFGKDLRAGNLLEPVGVKGPELDGGRPGEVAAGDGDHVPAIEVTAAGANARDGRSRAGRVGEVITRGVGRRASPSCNPYANH